MFFFCCLFCSERFLCFHEYYNLLDFNITPSDFSINLFVYYCPGTLCKCRFPFRLFSFLLQIVTVQHIFSVLRQVCKNSHPEVFFKIVAVRNYAKATYRKKRLKLKKRFQHKYLLCILQHF